MNLNLYSPLANEYKNNAQKIRILTENWVYQNIYCPNCGKSIKTYKNNKPVADFYCTECNEDYELKSKKDSIGKKIIDGAYSTMIERLQSSSNPNFFFLIYNKNNLNVFNFLVVPKYFFVPEIIEKRKPLSKNAKRAGWVGCNILISAIPDSGKIFYIKNGQIENKNKVMESWKKITFLKQVKNIKTKSWLIEIITCIEKLNKKHFTLNDLYAFENILKQKYPNNNNIKAKIRQQLQILRDNNYLTFIDRGKYKLN